MLQGGAINDADLDEEITELKERMLLNQMPVIGDLKSAKLIDIRYRIRAFNSLLTWKETKSVEIRQGFIEKLRKVTSERDVAERKCQRLEERLQNMDKQKYSLELRNKEMQDSAKKVSRQSTGADKSQD